MRIQCSINGYNGKPVTILSFLKDRILTVVKATAFSDERIMEDMATTGNVGGDIDYKFTDKDFQEAIAAYFEQTNNMEISIDESLARYKPDNRIEIDKIDEKGKSYRVSSDIDNGQIAIIATALFAKKQKGFQAVTEFMNEINSADDSYEMYKVITI